MVVAALAGAGESASSFYRKARKAHDKGDDAAAYLLVNRSIALDPANEVYHSFAEAVSTPRAAKSQSREPGRKRTRGAA